MQYRILGHSGIEVPVLSLGSWQTIERLDEQTGLAVMTAAIDAGITFLDDARYTDRTGSLPMETGYSEVVFGNLLRKGGWPREQLLIANKLWFEFYPQQSIEGELDASLARMQLEHFDLLYCAPPPESLALEELIAQMHGLVHAGRIRTWGVLNWQAAEIDRAVRYALELDMIGPCAAQLPYSLLRPGPVESPEMQQACNAGELCVIASASLAGGLLTGKYNRPETGQQVRLQGAQLARITQGNVLNKIRALAQEARQLDTSPAQLALAWCLTNSQVGSLVFGATSVAQVRENTHCLELLDRLDESVVERLRSLFRDQALDGLDLN